MKKTLSKKNPYYLSKYRRKELEYFCLQYPEWKEILRSMTGDISGSVIHIDGNGCKNTVEVTVEMRERYVRLVDLIDSSVRMVRDSHGERLCDTLTGDILYSVTKGIKYSRINAHHAVCCGERQFYEFIRQFYYILSQEIYGVIWR